MMGKWVIQVHMQQGLIILNVEKTGLEFVLPILSPELPNNSGWADS